MGRDGALRYVLLASISPDSLDRLLAAQQIPPDWIAGIADGRQVFIARNRNAEGFRARELIAPLKHAVRGAAAGSGRYPVFDSPDVYAAWQRTASPGWTVTLGAPVSAVDVPLRRSMWRLALGGCLGLLVGIALAIEVGRRISHSMGTLASAAAALGQGLTPPCSPSSIEEVHAVSHAMERAGQTIGERTAELQRSQATLRRLVDSSLIGVLFGEDDLITDANDAFLNMLGYRREDLRQGTLRESSLTPPEYGPADAAAARRARRPGDRPPHEKEYVRKDGTRVPVLVGGAFLDDARREWVLFVLDLTERNRLAAERTARMQAQRRARRRTTSWRCCRTSFGGH